LSPNLNHYKARFLNHLAQDSDIDLTILSGSGRQGMGDSEIEDEWAFNHIKKSVSKKEFGSSKLIRQFLKQNFKSYDWVLIPAEKKNIVLFIYALKLRLLNKKAKLISYNHPILKSGNGTVSILDRIMTKFYYLFFDRIIFYTEASYKLALSQNLITKEKAYWANNTIDTDEVKKYYQFKSPDFSYKSIVFIGRMIPSKRIDLLITYFETLQAKLPNENLKLEVIGDGPEMSLLNEAMKLNQAIISHGILVDEAKIAPIMERAIFVFIPGHSGLSVNHAFSYGRPYITLEGSSHAPEIDYIKHGINGYIFKESFKKHIDIITELITDQNKVNAFCESAHETGEYLSVQKWVQQIKSSLLHE